MAATATTGNLDCLERRRCRSVRRRSGALDHHGSRRTAFGARGPRLGSPLLGGPNKFAVRSAAYSSRGCNETDGRFGQWPWLQRLGKLSSTGRYWPLYCVGVRSTTFEVLQSSAAFEVLSAEHRVLRTTYGERDVRRTAGVDSVVREVDVHQLPRIGPVADARVAARIPDSRSACDRMDAEPPRMRSRVGVSRQWRVPFPTCLESHKCSLG